MRQALRERVAQAFPDPENRPTDGGVKRDTSGNMVAILCLCGAQIAGPVPLMEPEHADKWSVKMLQPETARGKIFVFGYFHLYQQAEMEFDDGGKHVSHGCRSCWQNMRDDTAERFYVRDLVGFDCLEAAGQDPMADSMWAQLLKRRPTTVRLITVN